MRVISGLRKGHRLKAPKGQDTRPTEDRVKESLFNILGKIDGDALVLDGFAGSGSIGIEFLSRGAKLSYFVDRSGESIRTIKENLKHTKFIDQAIVLKKDLLLVIKELERDEIKFDYIYLDPPFRQGNLINNVLEKISQHKILEEDGLIIIEHEKEVDLEDTIRDFKKVDCRQYGSKSISYYKRVN